jgi:hypothetical protein
LSKQLLHSMPQLNRLPNAVADKNTGLRIAGTRLHKNSVKAILSAANNVAGSSGASRLHAPVPREPAHQTIARHANAAGGGDRYREQNIAHLNAGHLQLNPRQEYRNDTAP